MIVYDEQVTDGNMNRLVLWYSLITVLFRCPSGFVDLNEDSPKICRPYLNLKSYTSPYIQPYYDSYIAPNVDVIRPYAEEFNSRVYTPSAALVKQTYDTYGGPRVIQAQNYTQVEWERTVRPRVEALRLRAKARYATSLAPHINKVSDAARPYYDNFQHSLLDIYYTSILPAYDVVIPYVEQGYEHGRKFTVDLALPYALWASDSTFTFLQRQLWPQVRILYGENVEPQLMRISERLGRYKDEKRVESAAEAVDRYVISNICCGAVMFIEFI
jgi:hypothetical protein